MQNLSLAVKIANLSTVDPVAGRALQMLDEAESSFEISRVLDWIDSQNGEKQSDS
jgi:hypothetical protein